MRSALRSDGPPACERARKGSIVDAVEPQILELLKGFPDMPGKLAQFDLWQPDVEIPVWHDQADKLWVVVGVCGFRRELTPQRVRLLAPLRRETTSCLATPGRGC